MAIEAQILALNTQFEAEKDDLIRLINKEKQRNDTLIMDRLAMAKLKQADKVSDPLPPLKNTDQGDSK